MVALYTIKNPSVKKDYFRSSHDMKVMPDGV